MKRQHLIAAESTENRCCDDQGLVQYVNDQQIVVEHQGEALVNYLVETVPRTLYLTADGDHLRSLHF
jgi:hypothetical protein